MGYSPLGARSFTPCGTHHVALVRASTRSLSVFARAAVKLGSQPLLELDNRNVLFTRLSIAEEVGVALDALKARAIERYQIAARELILLKSVGWSGDDWAA